MGTQSRFLALRCTAASILSALGCNRWRLRHGQSALNGDGRMTADAALACVAAGGVCGALLLHVVRSAQRCDCDPSALAAPPQCVARVVSQPDAARPLLCAALLCMRVPPLCPRPQWRVEMADLHWPPVRHRCAAHCSSASPRSPRRRRRLIPPRADQLKLLDVLAPPTCARSRTLRRGPMRCAALRCSPCISVCASADSDCDICIDGGAETCSRRRRPSSTTRSLRC